MSTGQAVTEAQVFAAIERAGRDGLLLDELRAGLGLAADSVDADAALNGLAEAGQIRFVGCKHPKHDPSCLVELKRGAR